MVGNIVENCGVVLYRVLRFLRGRTGSLVAVGTSLTRPSPRVQRGRKLRAVKAQARSLALPNLDILFGVLLLAFIVPACFIWAIAILPADAGLSDEWWNWHYIQELTAGRYAGFSDFPAYPILIALVMKALSFDSLTAARCVSGLLVLPAMVFCYRIARKGFEDKASVLSLQLFLCPLIFPFFFLLYAETSSLTLVLLSLLLTLNRRYWSAAAAAGVSVLMREGNIVWLSLFWLFALIDTGFFRPFAAVESPAGLKSLNYSGFAQSLQKTFLYPVICIPLIAYILFYDGMGLWDGDTHSLDRLHVTQLFLLLFAVFLLFLPLHLHNTPQIIRLLGSHPLLPLLCVLLYAVYITTFDASHDYNRDDFFMRNQLIVWLHASLLNRSLAFIPMLWAFLSLMVTPLRERKYYWLYPAAVVFLLPIWLVDPRYFIVPLALFMLFRKPLSDQLEYLIAAIYVPLTLHMFLPMAGQKLFI